MKEDNIKNGLGEDIGLIVLMGGVGFDLRDVVDLAEWSDEEFKISFKKLLG